MSYFPAFISIENKKILLVGGGKIALQKIKFLLDFTQNITILAPKISQEIEELIHKYDLYAINRNYSYADCKEYDIVIVAADVIELQKNIFEETRQYPKCFCSCVDNTDYCDFIFPSYIKKGDLMIAISTNGTSPAFSKQLRIFLESIVPDTVGEFLNKMKQYRKTLPKGKDRMQFLENEAKEYIKGWNK